MDSYEKKYKEAINRAKAMVKVANSQEEIYNSVITIFPELKESEDKMIREYLIRYIDNTMKSSELKSKLLAWLEKQGEKKPTDKVEPKFKVGDRITKNSKKSCPAHSSIDDTICEVAEVHDTCYILNTKEGRIQEPFEWQDYYELVEPAWSEEDECILNGILADYKSMCKTYRNWLESLKNRIQPKLQQEWSEEDEKIRKELIDYINRLTASPLYIDKYNAWISWLEKQGKQMSDPRYSILDKLIEADDIYQMSVNDAMVEEAKNKAIEALSKLEISKLLGLEKQSEQKLPIEKLPSEMKTIRESLGFTTQEECDEYNEMVTNLIMGDDDKGEQKTALSEEELTDFEKSLKHVMEETLECGDIHNLKADADLLLRLVKPTDDDMKEALRTEYEKGRADAFAQMQKEWSEEDEKMVANLVDYFKLDDALQYTEKQVVDWLKSLKGRAQLQPNQEWSEEDQNALEDVREAVVHYWGGDTQDILLYWLKSLKQRIAT